MMRAAGRTSGSRSARWRGGWFRRWEQLSRRRFRRLAWIGTTAWSAVVRLCHHHRYLRQRGKAAPCCHIRC